MALWPQTKDVSDKLKHLSKIIHLCTFTTPGEVTVNDLIHMCTFTSVLLLLWKHTNITIATAIILRSQYCRR